MRKSTKKVLIAMIALLIVLVIVIIVLVATDTQSVTEEDLGTTVIGEQAAAQADGTQEETTTAEVEPASVDLENEKEVSLYILSNGVATKVTSSYDSTWDIAEDINTFEAFNTDVDTFTYDSYYTVHEDYWNLVETDTVYKIGYQISFDVGDESHVITILEPDDVTESSDLYTGEYTYDDDGNVNNTADITGYLGVWLYDDTGHSSWYEHLTQSEVTDDTLITSIKLRPTPQSDQISNLTLTAFSYSSSEEFNSEGIYIGTHGYTIAVNNE